MTVYEDAYIRDIEERIEQLQELLEGTELGKSIENLQNYVDAKMKEVNKKFDDVMSVISGVDLDQLKSLIDGNTLQEADRNEIMERVKDIERFLDAFRKIKRIEDDMLDKIFRDTNFDYGTKERYNDYEYRNYNIQ
jgi:hypothetical protein